MSTAVIVVIVVVAVLVVAAVAVLPGMLRRRHLRNQFGPEYERVVGGTDDRTAAEKELAERERRHSTFELRSLSDSARDGYLRRWSTIQEQFVDEPVSAIGAADRLVTEVMADRGYPTRDFDQQADDLSVRYGDEVVRYRAAHELAARADSASTDDLRKALLDYRELVRSLANA
jgi:hypothetical protein